MGLRDYVAGLAFFVPTLGALAVAALLVVRRRYAHLGGAQLVLGYSVLLTLGVIAAHVIPMALGVLARGTVLATALALATAAWLLPTGRRAGDPPREPSPASGPFSVAVAAAGVSAAVVYQLARARDLAFTPLNDIDTLNFHLPGIARWIQSGSLWQIDQLFPYFVTGNYPNHGDVVTLAAVLPWRDIAFARFVELPFLALTGLAVYALACELRAPRATAAVFAAAVVMVPALSDYALQGLPDVIMLFAFATGVLFLLRHARTRRPSDLVMGGLALGIAFGTKWYGVTSVAVVLVVWAAASLIARPPVRDVARHGAALAGLIALGGGIWMLRNLVESGNPLYPQEIGAFGITVFDGPSGTILDQVGFTVADYLDDPSVLRDYIAPGLDDRLGIAGPVIAIGVALAAVAAAVAARRRPPLSGSGGAILAVSAAVALIAAVYAITPGSAFGREGEPVQAFTTVRWLVPAPLLGAGVAAAAGRIGWARPLLELAALAAVVDGIRRAPDVPLESALQVAAVLAVAAGLAWLAYATRPQAPSPGRERLLAPGKARLATAAAAAVAVVAILAVAGRAVQERFARDEYGSFDPTIGWIYDNAPTGHRIGLAGIWSVNGISPAFPAFGPRMRNEVVYVGPWEDGLLREYERRDPFVAALRRGRYDLLLVGRGQPPLGTVPEERWARSARFRRVAESERLALYLR